MSDRPIRVLVTITIISIALRVGAALYLGNDVVALPGTADQVSYHNLALRVLNGHGFSFATDWWPATEAGEPTAHWSYLYTLYLTTVYAIFGPHPILARLIQAILVGTLHPYLAYRLGQQTFGSRIGLIAAGLTSVYAYFIYYAATLMTESFYITAILASLYLMLQLVHAQQPKLRRTACLLGVVIGVAVLLRQVYLLVMPLLFLWLMWARYREDAHSVVKPLLLTLVVIAFFILPFTIYNYARFNRFVLLNTNAGYVLYWGNHPAHGSHFIVASEMGGYQELIPEGLRSLDEASLEHRLLGLGIQSVLDHPRRYALLCLSRISPYFRFWPSRSSSLLSNVARVASFGLAMPFMLYGLVRSLAAFRRKKSLRDQLSDSKVMLYIFMSSYSVIHILTWTLIRYRLPVDAVLLLLAGFGIDPLLRAVARKSLCDLKGTT